MAEQNLSDVFREALLTALEETFENIQGMYLDEGTSLFETLATISAEEASQPVSANCASIAAQVEHINFFMETLLNQIKGDRSPVDWSNIWDTVEVVTPEEWEASQAKLRETYANIRELASHTDWTLPNAVSGAMGLIMHNAYHLGEIRQALCTIRQSG